MFDSLKIHVIEDKRNDKERSVIIPRVIFLITSADVSAKYWRIYNGR